MHTHGEILSSGYAERAGSVTVGWESAGAGANPLQWWVNNTMGILFGDHTPDVADVQLELTYPEGSKLQINCQRPEKKDRFWVIRGRDATLDGSVTEVRIYRSGLPTPEELAD
jgi:hypothetical protein